jgi:hypothetical protein
MAGLFYPAGHSRRAFSHHRKHNNMAKIILGKRPETFPHTVTCLMVDGSEGSIGVTYKYRTREEFGEFADGIKAEAEARVTADVDRIKALAEKGERIEPMTQSEILARETAFNVDYIMGCVTGWDLDEAFDRAAVVQLANEVPASIPAIIGDYRDAIVTGRLGN